jgi:hypothetical protein
LLLGLVATGLTRYLIHSIRPAHIVISSTAALTIDLILLATRASDADILGLDIPLPAHHSIWRGYVLPGRNRHNVQRSPQDTQGIAGSQVATVVNYSVSLGLGFAATVEVYMNNGATRPDDILKGFKDVWRLGIRLGGLRFLVAVTYLVKELLQTLRCGDVDGKEE